MSATKRAKTSSGDMEVDLSTLARGLQTDPLPINPGRSDGVPHAPPRTPSLSAEDRKLALRNALRYFPAKLHAELAPEFAKELEDYGHIYCYRFRPTAFAMRAYPLEQYPAKCVQAAAIQIMIMNNLDPAVAQFPEELVTYGGNGSVFNNWAQFWLVMQYLSTMTKEQTLTIYSGHPMGLFPSSEDAPRVVLSNGMMVPNFCTPKYYDLLYAQGNSLLGQMTAGSYCYVGPQGIVAGSTLTLINAGRKYLKSNSLAGRVYVSSGLGGMSGAQGKASDIAGLVGVIAEVDESALMKRFNQGWIKTVARSVEECLALIRKHRDEARALCEQAGLQRVEGVSIGFLGNVVDLWEALADEAERDGGDMLVDLGSDQTSLHNPFNGGYYPAGVPTVAEAQALMVSDPDRFKTLVQESLRRHVAAINRLAARGMFWWDYGNCMLAQAAAAGANVLKKNPASDMDFRYPSYFQDIMGDIFSLGFGPYRWVCTSGRPEDLQQTDRIAAQVIKEQIAGLATPVAESGTDSDGSGEDLEGGEQVDPSSGMAKLRQLLQDSLLWMEEADGHKMVVGSQARILYIDAEGRNRIAQAFNDAIKDGRISGPVVLSRDHHDPSGSDSPYRETSNVTDGSMFCADMATQNAIGLSFRGATWLALHNGGGTGWGNAINGGFGLVLDGTPDASRRAKAMLHWDVNNGVSRRAWGRNQYAEFAARRAMQAEPRMKVTMPEHVDEDILNAAL